MIVIDLKIIPQRIPPEKWKSVYQETLRLVGAYDFMDKVTAERNGLHYHYAKRTRDDGNLLGTGFRGWRTVGSMHTGENTDGYMLFGDIRAYLPEEPRADRGGDILVTDFFHRAEAVNIVNLWGGRTNGQESHIYLLAIACLIVDRLPEAAMVSGSISAGQCRRAVRWANGCLSQPIRPPVTACMDGLLERLGSSKLSAAGKLEAFFGLTIEARDKAMGEFLRRNFDRQELLAHYKKRFLKFHVGQRGFASTMKEYLEMGFDFLGLCMLAVSDSDGPRVGPEDFLRRVIAARLYIKDKETGDLTQFATEKEGCEEVEDGRSVFLKTMGLICGAQNRNVDAFYPLEKIREDCRKAFGNRCRVDQVIDRLVAEDREQGSKAGKLQELLYDAKDSIFQEEAQRHKKLASEKQKGPYDVNAYREMVNFVPGCTVRPEMEKDIMKNFRMLRYFVETEFGEFRLWDRVKRENYFINNNNFLLLGQEVWERIFDRVMDDAYIIRFFGIFSVNCIKKGGYNFCRNMLSNLQAFDYFWDKAGEAEGVSDGK